MELNRNDPCQCDSGLKYKHCCLKMHQERKKWEELENNLRESITEYWQEFHTQDLYNAINLYGKAIDRNTEVAERRLFFDWFIHDYIIPNKNNTIIKLFLKEYEKEESKDTIELNTLREWSNSFFRFVEILEITIGTGYKVSDVFTKEEFFIHDVTSSTSVKKYDIIYLRLYEVGGSIIRTASGMILLSRIYLHNIKNYIINNMEKKDYKIDNITANSNDFNLILKKYLKNESLSLIKYLESLSTNQNTKTITTTFEGDLAVVSESSFIIKNKRKLISTLNSSEYFAYLEDYDNEEDDTIRFDWVEKLDVSKNLTDVDTNNDISKESEEQNHDYETEEPRELRLNTILWLPFKNNQKGSSFKQDGEKYIPYRVLGNLSIKGKILIIECTSDKLLNKCNNIINSIAGKYLVHLGDKYTELEQYEKEDRSNTGSLDISKDYNKAKDKDKKEEFKDEIPLSLKRQIDNYFEKYYEDWIYMKIPSLDNMTPLEVVKTKGGREKIEEMLRKIENELERSNMDDVLTFPIEKIRKKLGLI